VNKEDAPNHGETDVIPSLSRFFLPKTNSMTAFVWDKWCNDAASASSDYRIN